jgi:methylated-DNA-protein-cysteine methyltransferase-like protein
MTKSRKASGQPSSQPSGWNDYYKVVRRIPKGKVSTYGAIADFAGRPRSARHVGYALAALRGTANDVPWHRVMGAHTKAKAKVVIRDPIGGSIQRGLLEDEGVEFDERGHVSLVEYGWTGPRRKSQKTRPRRA